MELEPIQNYDERIDQLLRAKLHIDVQTDQLLNSLCKQYNAQDPFSQLGKIFNQKNRQIQSLTKKNQRLLQQNRRLKSQKNFAHLNLSYSPENVQGNQQRFQNQKISQSMIQDRPFETKNISFLNQTQISLDSQTQKSKLKEIEEMVDTAREENIVYTHYNQSFLIYLIKTINQLSIKKKEETQLENSQENKQKLNKNIKQEDQTVNIPIASYKRLIEAYCVFTAQKSTSQIIPKYIREGDYFDKSHINYKQLITNLKLESPDNFQSIFAVISSKLGLSEQWKNFISKKQSQYAQMYENIAKIVQKKLQFDFTNIKSESERYQRTEQFKLFHKLTQIIQLQCVKFTKMQKNLWKDHVSKKHWLNYKYILEQLNKNVDTKLISEIVKQLHSGMFKKCLNCIWQIITQNGLQVANENKLIKVFDQKDMKNIQFILNRYIENVVNSPSKKQDCLKRISQIEDIQFKIVKTFMQRHTYFYTGVNNNPQQSLKR